LTLNKRQVVCNPARVGARLHFEFNSPQRLEDAIERVPEIRIDRPASSDDLSGSSWRWPFETFNASSGSVIVGGKARSPIKIS
jgi:hypothetical protein